MKRDVQIAKDLLSIRAVFFRPEEPFTWASGIKSPVYCDNRLTLSAPAVRQDVEEAALDCPVPLLTVQPVLENAVEHGIAPAGGGEIGIA